MNVTSLATATAFTTKDGSTIRELHHTAAQSLAEASLEAGATTDRHYHARTEEIYFFLAGAGEVEIDGNVRTVAAGEAVLIPPGARHAVTAGGDGARFLCCCSPPYTHDDTILERDESRPSGESGEGRT